MPLLPATQTWYLAWHRTSAGYFDQAQFGHEFRAFTGLTPTRYVESRGRDVRAGTAGQLATACG